MADRPIIRIEYNDDDKRFREKCNSNFQQLASGTHLTGPVTRVIQDAVAYDMEDILAAAFNESHPIGDIIFTNDQNDKRLSRGRWRRIEDVLLVAAGDDFPFNETGGEAEHTLTVDELPVVTVIQNSHNHTQTPHTHSALIDEADGTLSGTADEILVSGPSASGTVSNATAINVATTATNRPFGGGEPHNNMGPYIGKYCFERIA